jgi:hypothetical protein
MSFQGFGKIPPFTGASVKVRLPPQPATATAAISECNSALNSGSNSESNATATSTPHNTSNLIPWVIFPYPTVNTIECLEHILRPPTPLTLVHGEPCPRSGPSYSSTHHARVTTLTRSQVETLKTWLAEKGFECIELPRIRWPVNIESGAEYREGCPWIAAKSDEKGNLVGWVEGAKDVLREIGLEGCKFERSRAPAKKSGPLPATPRTRVEPKGRPEFYFDKEKEAILKARVARQEDEICTVAQEVRALDNKAQKEREDSEWVDVRRDEEMLAPTVPNRGCVVM